MPGPPSRVVSLGRVGLGVFAVAAACAGIVLLVGTLPDSAPAQAAAAALGCIYLLMIASVLEWMVHRYVYHRRWLPFARRIYSIHHRGHHFEIFPTWRYVTNGP